VKRKDKALVGIVFLLSCSVAQAGIYLTREGRRTVRPVRAWIATSYSTGESVRSSAFRLGSGGFQNWMGMDFMVTRFVNLRGFAVVTSDELGTRYGGGGEVLVRLYDRASESVYVKAGVLNTGISTGVYSSAGAYFFKGKLGGGGEVEFEKYFGSGHDAVDVNAMVFFTWKPLPWLETGPAYYVQDIEDVWEDEEAEGGASHLVVARIGFKLAGFLFTLEPGYGFYRNNAFVVNGKMTFNF